MSDENETKNGNSNGNSNGNGMDFALFKTAVSAQFNRMQKHPMFRVEVDKDELWSTYLDSFPAGTNLIYRERREYDCSCCRQFIRTVGDAVAVIDGELVSMWSVEIGNQAFQAVSNALATLVLSSPIHSPFLHYEPHAGTDRNFEQLLEGVKTWNHFHVHIDKKFVKAKDLIPSFLSEQRSNYDVFLRSLVEITPDSIDTVLDLIAQGSLYRGEEHRPAVVQFKETQNQFRALASEQARIIYPWITSAPGSVSRIRNTVIGSLLVDLSEGRDLEEAVKSFELKAAPTNYKRPSALITPGMVIKAKEKIEELGLTSALERRYARLEDITINDVLFADRAAKKAISGGVFDGLVNSTAAVSSAPKNLDRIEEVHIDYFLSEIVTRAESIKILFENKHQGNLVSLIAPVDPTARPLFKWPNNFSWSYVGEVADSIREKVKQAGGNITGDICCRLAWHNYDDLDLHMKEPKGQEIYYGSRYSYHTKGQLDVDMNVRPTTKEPVENIFYGSRLHMVEGNYHLFVHQFTKRDSVDVGFECEIDYLGTVHRFAYAGAVRQNETITVAKFKYTHKGGLEIIESLPSTQTSRVLWNLPTQAFHRVQAITLSPNYWQERAVGNKHYFFMLADCRNDGTARGFFNEFLSESLTPHRKVFEVVGSKMKPAESEHQLSGLGFSSTQRNSLVCRVKGSFTRTIKVTF